jgi:predicted GIY-YIG superfamily endonuclease
MAWVYILKGAKRHYLGSTVDLDARVTQHQRGHTHTTKRLGKRLARVARKDFATLSEARNVERMLKGKKNPQLAIHYLQH